MKPPPVEYAIGPEGRVAYQVVGDGPIDLVFVPFFARHNLDIIWEHPPLERYLRRLASFSRLILFDCRGTGLSDPIPRGRAPLPEEWMTDIRVVLDAIGSERAALFSLEWGCASAAMFASTFPERTLSVVFLNCFAAALRDVDYPWGFPPHVFDGFAAALVANWGTGRNLDFMAPDLAREERFREWFARLERTSCSPGVVEGNITTVGASDVRGVLPSIKAPTLVISHTDVHWIRLGHGRYLAEHIPNARYLERPGTWGGIYWTQDVDWTLDEVQAFLTGTRGAPDLDDRVLATVLFTDIIGSTERAAELGDGRWREVLDEHDTIVKGEIERFRGRAVNFTGDGFLATFDGPARAIRCAVALSEAVRALGLEVRTGLHTGEIEQRADNVGGIAVHIGARVMKEAGPNEVFVSGAVPPLVAGSGIEFEDRGARALKGVPGEWRLFAVKT